MPFNIQGAVEVAGSVVYMGDQATAKENLAKLRAQLQGTDGSIKSGVLKLVKVRDGYQLRRTQWYHFGSRSTAKMEEAAAFVTAMVQAAYPQATKVEQAAGETTEPETTEEKVRKAFIPHMEGRLVSSLTSYLCPKHRRVGTQGLMKVLKSSGLAVERINICSREEKQRLQDVIEGCEEDFSAYEEKEIRSFLSQCGLQIEKQSFGSGGFGDVYGASLKEDPSKGRYVFKFERETTKKPRPERKISELTNHGDLAASKVATVKHMTQPIFVLFKVNRGTSEYHYVPAGKAEEFKQSLQSEEPSATYSVVGQLMARAPGKELAGILRKSPDLCSKKPKAFKKVVVTLCRFFETAWEKNYCHFDIKPANIHLMMDRGKEECTLLDGGIAMQQEEQDFPAYPHGTRCYMHPFLYPKGHQKGQTHRSEVDAYSIAMTLLEVVAPKDFKIFDQAISCAFEAARMDNKGWPDTHPVFGTDLPSTYLNKYLETIRSQDGSISATKRALEADPQLKELLQQCFEVSGFHTAGSERDDAFIKWKAAFEAYKASATA